MMLGKNSGVELILDRIGLGTIGVEIGVWRGDSSERFLSRAAWLHMVDPWSVLSYENSDEFGDYQAYLRRYSGLVGSSDPADFQSYYDALFARVVQRFSGRPVTIHRCTSREFFAGFNSKVDWVYIDGAHNHADCLADLHGAHRIAKGSIFGDDYGNKPGVTKALDDFLAATRLPHAIFGTQYQVSVLEPPPTA